MDQAKEIVPAEIPRRRPRGTAWNQDEQPRNVTSRQTVSIFITDDPANSGGLIKAMLREIHESQNPQRICAFAGSLVAAGFRDLRPTLESAMRDMIGNVCIVDDANRAAHMFELEEADSLQITRMHIAQTILLIFKNISQSSYEGFLIKRIKSLKAVMGLPENEVVEMVMPIDKAIIVKAKLGSHVKFKKHLLEILLAHRNDSTQLGVMCNYLCNMLDWNEMTNVLFVIQTLIAPESPVLFDLRISSDVLNFLEAAKAIHSSSYYGYFRIRETNQFKRGLVERSKFPILSAVAQKIKSQTAASVMNYKGLQGQVPAVVDLLVAKHNHYMNGIQPDIHRSRIKFLTAFNDEE